MAQPRPETSPPPVTLLSSSGRTGRPGTTTETAGGEAPTPPQIITVNRFPALEVTRAGLVLLGLLLGVYLLWRVQEVIFLVFLAILLATAIEPAVKWLRQGPFTRGSGVL